MRLWFARYNVGRIDFMLVAQLSLFSRLACNFQKHIENNNAYLSTTLATEDP